MTTLSTPRCALALLALLLTASAGSGCGSQCELNDQQEQWEKLTDIGKGSFSCGSTTEPYGCQLGSPDCMPTLYVLFPEGTTPAEVDAQAKATIEKVGFSQDGEMKSFEDGSLARHFVQGDDKIVYALGKLGEQIELTVVRRSQLDE